MLDVNLPSDIEKRIEDIAEKAGVSKSEFAREAIITYLEDLEDGYLALQRLEADEPRTSLEELMKEFEPKKTA